MSMIEEIEKGAKFDVDEMVEELKRLESENLQLKASRKRGSGRKLELLEVLAEGPAKIIDIAAQMNVSTKNVSSLKCYLRKDGWGIINNEEGETQLTKFKGKKIDSKFIKEFIENERKVMEASQKSEAE